MGGRMKVRESDQIESLAFNDDLSCLICASSTGYRRLSCPWSGGAACSLPSLRLIPAP